MTRKCIAKLMNKKTKTIFALVDDGDGTFRVLKLCENHDGQVRGGISKTWRFIERGLSRAEAKALFDRRVGA